MPEKMTAQEFLKSGLQLKDLPNEQRTPEVCEAAIHRSGKSFRDVPLWLRTLRLARLAVGTHAPAYLHAPHGVRKDYELAKLALRRGGLSVWDGVPPEIRNYELCLFAVKTNGALLKVIEARFRDFDMCKAAFSSGGADLADVPDVFLRDANFWLGVALKHIPDAYKTYDLCLNNVRKCGNYLQYVPEAMRDAIMSKAAIAENPWTCRFVPEKYHNQDFFIDAYRAARAAGSPFTIASLERKSA